MLTALPGSATDITPIGMVKTIPPYDSAKSSETAQFQLRQPCVEFPDSDFQPATFEVAQKPHALMIKANPTDANVLTKGSVDDQRLWELGDVFEIFIMVEGRSDYIELHVAPGSYPKTSVLG